MNKRFRRALNSLGHGKRWVIVNAETGKLSGLRTTYPEKHVAERFAGPGEEVIEVNATRRTGPFSEQIDREL